MSERDTDLVAVPRHRLEELLSFEPRFRQMETDLEIALAANEALQRELKRLRDSQAPPAPWEGESER